MKKIYIELTDEQKEKLSPLFDSVLDATVIEPVMLLAQIHFVKDGAVAICGIIEHETYLKIQESINPKYKSKIADGDFVRRILRKARTT